MFPPDRAHGYALGPTHIRRADHPLVVREPPVGVEGATPGATPRSPGSLPPSDQSNLLEKRTSYDMQAWSYDPLSLMKKTLPSLPPELRMRRASNAVRTTLPLPRESAA